MNRSTLVLACTLSGACGNEKTRDTSAVAPPNEAPSLEEDPGSALVWGDAYVGSDPTVPFLPDGNARYWRYAFDRPPAGSGLLIDGSLQGVRYEAVDVYDDQTRTSIGVLRDTELAGALRLWVADAEEHAALDAPALPLPEGRTALFLRMYDPEGVAPAPDLPLVSLVELSTGRTSAAPARIEPMEIPQSVIDAVVERQAIEQREDRVDFYHLEGAGLYAAADNAYLVAQITREPGEVVVVSFEPPTHASAASEVSDVRYWSFTQCDRHSYCHHTLADIEVPRQDGPVELVIGDDIPEVRAAVGDRLFVPWSTPDDEMVLIYRNLATAPEFDDAIETVPVFDHALPAAGQEATATLGARAPSGFRCALADLAAGACGA